MMDKNKKNVWTVAIVTIALIGGLLLGNVLAKRSQMQRNGNFDIRELIRIKGNKVNELLTLIDKQYVDDIDVDSLTEDVMRDIIAKLDPHSVYIPAEDLASVESELEGSFSGIGVQFNIQNDTIMVVSVISGGPSEKVGMLAGDRIVAVNDSAFVGKELTNEKVMKTLRGPKDTEVKLGIKRHGTAEILHYAIVRGDIPINTVTAAYIIEPTVGYIGVNSNFGNNTYNEFVHAIAELKAQGANKFIVDLRENSGGLMEVAIQMINEFLPQGQMIVYSEGKAYPKSEAIANGTGSCTENPIVVLVDEFSASASEIFAGAIQDNDRGTVVGRRTFGKGLVQTQIPFSDRSAVRLTIARYFTPSGRSIQKPYKNGNGDEYAKDLINRFEHGEFDSKDSIHFADTVAYKTLNGRTVYGGGGIMPDIFVPRDTSQYSPYFTKAVNYGYMYQFAFRYTDQHRSELNQYKTWKEMNNHLLKQPIINEFSAFSASKGLKANSHDLQVSGKLMGQRIRSYIIRNMLSDEGFYPMINEYDTTVQTALKEIKK